MAVQSDDCSRSDTLSVKTDAALSSLKYTSFTNSKTTMQQKTDTHRTTLSP